MNNYETYAVRIQKNLDVLEGFLFFITDHADLAILKPHEYVISEKINRLIAEIKSSAQVRVPILCVSEQLELTLPRTYSTAFCYVDDGTLVRVDYTKYPTSISIKNPLLVADGHHRLKSLSRKDVFAAAGSLPVFLVSGEKIKIEPFVHYQAIDVKHLLTLNNMSILFDEMVDEVHKPYKARIYLNNQNRDIHFSNIVSLNALSKLLFTPERTINYIRYSNFISTLASNTLQLAGNVILQFPHLSISQVCEIIHRDTLLPQHCTCFYPKVPLNFLPKLLARETNYAGDIYDRQF